MITKEFVIAPILHDGKPILQIRRAICNKKEIDAMLSEILEKKEIRIEAVVKFRDRFCAVDRLRRLGMLPEGYGLTGPQTASADSVPRMPRDP